MLIRIRNAQGLYSKGGYMPSFTKSGKTWSSLGYVKSHLNQINKSEIREIYQGCTLVEIDENTASIKESPMSDFIDIYLGKKDNSVLKSKMDSIKRRINNISGQIEILKGKSSQLTIQYNDLKKQLRESQDQ